MVARENDAAYFRRRAADEAARAQAATCAEAMDAHRRLATLFSECAERCDAPDLIAPDLIAPNLVVQG